MPLQELQDPLAQVRIIGKTKYYVYIKLAKTLSIIVKSGRRLINQKNREIAAVDEIDEKQSNKSIDS